VSGGKNPVVIEIRGKFGDVGFALFWVGAVDATEGWGGEGRRASAKERIDVHVDIEASMIRVDDMVKVQPSAAQSVDVDSFRGKDIIDTSAFFASRNFRVGAMAG
jgi:hypothetical protein